MEDSPYGAYTYGRSGVNPKMWCVTRRTSVSTGEGVEPETEGYDSAGGRTYTKREETPTPRPRSGGEAHPYTVNGTRQVGYRIVTHLVLPSLPFSVGTVFKTMCPKSDSRLKFIKG